MGRGWLQLFILESAAAAYFGDGWAGSFPWYAGIIYDFEKIILFFKQICIEFPCIVLYDSK